MKNYKSPYLYDNELGRVNAWEYYFEQPGNISIEEALSNETYITPPDTSLYRFPEFIRFFYYNYGGELDHWRKLCKKYIRFKPAVLEKLSALQEKTKGKRLLGMLVRGTDYVSMKLKHHPIPPTAEQAIEKAQEVLREKNFDAVYLATEDKNILAKFQAAFGNKLVVPEADYLDYDYSKKNPLFDYSSNRPNDKYLRGLDYVVSMLFLSKCAGFITSMTSGSEGVMCLSEGFEYFYLFDFGVYE